MPSDSPLDSPLCEHCAESLYPVGPACPRCANPCNAPVSLLCGRCRRQPPPFDAIYAPFRYGGELATALRKLKFNQRPDIARTLAPLLAPAIKMAAVNADIAIAIPLHRKRLAQRGFNQAALLLRYAAPKTLIQCDWPSLHRTKPTTPQNKLSVTKRRLNLAEAFTVPPRFHQRVSGKRVILVDDIVTTGATMASATRTLLAVGARSVVGCCLARAELF